jgi:hypothetical protein
MFRHIVISISVLFAISNKAFAAEESWGFRDHRVGLGYLYLHQEDGGDVSTGNLMYDFNFFSKESFSINTSIIGTAYKDSESGVTFWTSAYRLVGSYQIAETNFKPQILFGYELWDGRGLRFEYGLGVEYGLQRFESVKSFIDSAFLQVGKINDANEVTFINAGLYKNF